MAASRFGQRGQFAVSDVSSRFSNSYPVRAARLLKRIVSNSAEQAGFRRLQKQYSARAFDKTIDWDWSGIRYNRGAVLSVLAARNLDAAYLEIGCFRNDVFDSLPLSNKVGVDPVEGGTVRATSDEFFASNEQRFDLVFIDGLHVYEQVHRDVANALKSVNPGSWIAMHDMLPRNWFEQNDPPLKRGAWTGDCWKVSFELMQTAGIDYRILKVDHGVGVIRVNEPGAELADLGASIGDAHFQYYYDNLGRLPLVSWEEALPWLRQP